MNAQTPRPVDLPHTDNWNEADIIAGPSTLADRQQWRSRLVDWRKDAATGLNYDDNAYQSAELFNNPSYSVALIWLWDELLFDFSTQEFTPDKLLADAQKFGSFDGIILWHAYPVIGIDSRNQFDFYNDVPGLAQLITNFQKAGVKVYLNYNPWDKWTRRESTTDQFGLAQLIKRFNFDGVFLDTLKSADPDFMAPIIDVKPDIVLGGEATVQQERVCDHTMSWGQWFVDSEIPGVLRAKYFEPRHMIHQTRRWDRSHIGELHIAWLNGAGMLIWEAVFGSWVGWNNYEVCMWREMVSVLRDHHPLIVHGHWEPLTQLSAAAEAAHLYASSFKLDGWQLITIINKSRNDYLGVLACGLSGLIPAGGVGAISITPSGASLLPFTYMKSDQGFPTRTPARQLDLVGSLTTLTYSHRHRECGFYEQPGFINTWKPTRPALHEFITGDIEVPVVNGVLDTYEVSNREFYEFMQATHYVPEVSNRFLSHWVNGAPLTDQLDNPIVYVDLDDAVAYSRWKGSEVPNEWNWQFNADSIVHRATSVWNLTNSIHSDGRTRFLILKGGSTFNIHNGQGAQSPTGLAESDWYIDGGIQDSSWNEKLLLMGAGMSRSENIGFRCFRPHRGN
jgi:hypothetical protein